MSSIRLNRILPDTDLNIGSSTPAIFTGAGILTIANSTSIANSNSFTGTGGSANINGDVTLYNAIKNTIAFRNVGFAAPTVTTRSIGTKIVLFGGLTGFDADYALGVENGGLWSSVSAIGDNFYWYGATTRVMTLSGTGNLNTTGNTASTSNTTGSLRTAGGIATSNTTDAISVTNGGTFTSGGGGAFAKKLFVGTDTTLASVSGITTIGSSTPTTISAAGVLTVANTTASTTTTTGSLIISGGAGIAGALHANSGNFTTLFAATKNLTPNTDDITSQVSFSGAQGASNSNVTGLLFNPVNTMSFEIQLVVFISATTSMYSQFKLQGVYNGTSWYFSSSYIGDNTLITFSITNDGQIRYSSSTYTGFTSLIMKFRANTLAI